ncbi:glycosyltransferase involved in cell wall biosynthesis [Ochrobactrum daejeonense]|uniref:Glycosyltransferase involved in cell wall biosynthesis n=1 Tax=Brucella daejeonensis TaxID=659015 RepID=A0A7W9ELZ0_9HYPH|nr:glycosyltransferase family 4 protein [Brucella daejeonensis]MBB5702852.1 glycosyltransferase involved in cell wall biosynthesis [Brucella daejeonensis]
MRVVLANRYFHPDQSATSRMVTSLARTLVREGIETVVLASRSYHDRRNEALPARETVDGIEVHRIRTSGFGRSRLVGRAVDYATFHLSAAAWFAANARKDDICVICTDPPLLSVSAALPIRFRGARMVNWVMDLFPETAMELGLVSPDAFSGKLTIALRDWSMRRSALTICPIDRMARYLASRDIPAESLSVVHHWADRNEIMPVEPARNPLRRAWGLGHKFVVGYSGNFGRAHEFATVLDAAERLKHMKSIVFLMVGEGQQRGYVESEVKRRGLSNVVMKPFQPVEKLSESLCAANVHLVSLKPELEHCIVPSKFYGVLAAARPTIFIGDTEGEIGAIVRDFECGIALRPGEVDALVMAILHLRHSRVSRTTMGHNARYLMETAYSREYGTAMWQSAIGRLEEEAIPPTMPVLDRRFRPREM